MNCVSQSKNPGFSQVLEKKSELRILNFLETDPGQRITNLEILLSVVMANCSKKISTVKCFRAYLVVCMFSLHLEVGEFLLPDPKVKCMDPDHDTGSEA